MLLWFLIIALLGLWGIAQHPAVLFALNPRYGIGPISSRTARPASPCSAACFLCVTGAEALYADMGHFGARPIRLGLVGVLVFPSLILNYAGQAAIVLAGAPTSGNIFFRLCPPIALVPLVILATVATIIASQSIITGAFSMTRQAIQLGWLPRLQIRQTSAEGYGQIYVPTVNWLLMIVTIGLTIGFRKSETNPAPPPERHRRIGDDADDLGAAVHRDARDLALASCRRRRGRGATSSSSIAGFVAANLLKFMSGGYVAVSALALLIYVRIMAVWHIGRAPRAAASTIP